MVSVASFAKGIQMARDFADLLQLGVISLWKAKQFISAAAFEVEMSLKVCH